MSNVPVTCQLECLYKDLLQDTKFLVLTGGPGAGKTAVLEMIKKMLCEQVAVLPESASIVFGGGFWRLESDSAKVAAQKAIFHVQRHLEELVFNEKKWSLALCDRGTLDGLAYWPASEETFWSSLGVTKNCEYDRYQAIIHLRSPSEIHGYNNHNPLRIETALQAQEIDEKIHKIWKDHPNYSQIPSTPDFLEKAHTAIDYISHQLPECCQKGLLDFQQTKKEAQGQS